MIVRYDITPLTTNFTLDDVKYICESLGGNLDTVVGMNDDNKNFFCGDFEFEASFDELRQIKGCSKFYTLVQDVQKMSDAQLKEKFLFTCVVMRPLAEKLLIVDIEPVLNKPIHVFEIPLDEKEYHLNFIQQRDRFFVDYNAFVQDDNPELAVFELKLVDTRHIWATFGDKMTSLN